jgi:hypothetical protein
MSVAVKVKDAQLVTRGTEVMMGMAGVTADQLAKMTGGVKVLVPETT